MARRKIKTRKPAKVSLSSEMTNQELLLSLETMVKALNLELRYERGDFKGGMCRVHEQKFIVIQKKETIENKIKTLAFGLGQLDLKKIYILPAVQKLIDQVFIESETSSEVQE